MNAKISVLVIRVEVIIYLLLYHLHDCTFTEVKSKNPITPSKSSECVSAQISFQGKYFIPLTSVVH